MPLPLAQAASPGTVLGAGTPRPRMGASPRHRSGATGLGRRFLVGAGLARQQDTGQSAGAWKQQPQTGHARVEAAVAEEGAAAALRTPAQDLSPQHSAWSPGRTPPAPRGCTACAPRGPAARPFSPGAPAPSVPAAPRPTARWKPGSSPPPLAAPAACSLPAATLQGCCAAPPAERTPQPGMPVWTAGDSRVGFF